MTLDDHALNELAIRVMTAQDRRGTLAPMSSDAPFDIPTSYAVADRVHRMRIAQGAVPVGRKIGFTNRNIWDEYGVHQPIWGWMYEHTLVHSRNGHARISIEHFAEPRIEPEIVFHFASAPLPDANVLELLGCIDWIAHGFEIVQSHYPDWKFLVEDTIADGGLHGALVLGEPVPVTRLGDTLVLVEALAKFEIDLARNAQRVETGRGANVLDSPLNALVHLCDALKQSPHLVPIEAEELITTGTLTAAYPLVSGEHWSTSLRGLALPGLSLAIELA
jgi:2-oxo-3-hexenedioate decarboxylase